MQGQSSLHIKACWICCALSARIAAQQCSIRNKETTCLFPIIFPATEAMAGLVRQNIIWDSHEGLIAANLHATNNPKVRDFPAFVRLNYAFVRSRDEKEEERKNDTKSANQTQLHPLLAFQSRYFLTIWEKAADCICENTAVLLSISTLYSLECKDVLQFAWHDGAPCQVHLMPPVLQHWELTCK